MAMSKKEKIAEKQLIEYGYEYARTPAEDEQRRQEAPGDKGADVRHHHTAQELSE